jgi:hypothetical protein
VTDGLTLAGSVRVLSSSRGGRTCLVGHSDGPGRLDASTKHLSPRRVIRGSRGQFLKRKAMPVLLVVLTAAIALSSILGSVSPANYSSRNATLQSSLAQAQQGRTSVATHPDATTDAISVAGTDPTTVALSWAQSGDFCFDSYYIQEATYSSGGPWTTIATVTSASVTAIFVPGFSPGATAWFQDVDNSGCGGGSATSNVVQPSFPNYATVSYSDTGSSTVQLSWNNNANYGGLLSFDQYLVQEQINSGGFSTVATISSESTTTNSVTGVTGLNTGTAYQFRIQTTDDCNDCSGGTYPQSSNSNTVTHLAIDQPTASPASIELGQSIQFSVSATGGQSPYSYSWSGLPSGCSSTNSNPLSCTPSSTGTSSVTVTVTDSLGITLTSLSVSATVVAVLTVAQPTVSASSVTVGQTVVFTASVTGGTAPYTYSWTGLPTGCSSSDASQVSCVPTTTGSWSVSVIVTDSSSVSRTSAPVTVSVTSSSSGGSGGSGLSGSSITTDDWIAIGAVILLVIIVSAVVLVIRGRKPKSPQGTPSSAATPPAQWQPPSGGTPPTPPSGGSAQ